MQDYADKAEKAAAEAEAFGAAAEAGAVSVVPDPATVEGVFHANSASVDAGLAAVKEAPLLLNLTALTAEVDYNAVQFLAVDAYDALVVSGEDLIAGGEAVAAAGASALDAAGAAAGASIAAATAADEKAIDESVGAAFAAAATVALRVVADQGIFIISNIARAGAEAAEGAAFGLAALATSQATAATAEAGAAVVGLANIPGVLVALPAVKETAGAGAPAGFQRSSAASSLVRSSRGRGGCLFG